MNKLLSLLVVAALFSCTKENDPEKDPPRGVPGKLAIEHYSRTSPQTRTYSYNADGALQWIRDEFERRITDQFEYSYTNGQLRSGTMYSGSNNNGLEHYYDYRFTYDNKNRLSVLYSDYIPPYTKDSTIRSPDRFEFMYASGTDSLPNRCIVSDKRNSEYLPFYEYRMTYDARGNLSMLSLYIIRGGTYDKQYDYLYEYQPVNNPKYHIDVLLPENFSTYYSPDVCTKEILRAPNGTEYVTNIVYETDASLRVKSVTVGQGSKIEYEYY